MSEEQKKEEFEIEIEGQESAAPQQEAEPESDDTKLEVQDDTPEQDRGREPLPKDVVEKLEKDDLEEYSEKVKTRLLQMKKVWHDERRAKEAADRERQEAIAFAQKILEENKRLKTTLSEGEKSYVDTAKAAANLELEMAKKAYKEAYESGDSEQVMQAQQKLNEVGYKVQRLNEYRPSLQQPEIEVNSEPKQVNIPRPDKRTMEWQERNTWFGTDEEMTSLALGLHQKLEKQYGAKYIGTDEYWNTVDETMKKRFPDYFGEDVQTAAKTENGGGKPVVRTEKPATVVAPASRSTSSKKIVLKQSQLNIAKRLGLTPEQYAKEFMRLENQNG